MSRKFKHSDYSFDRVPQVYRGRTAFKQPWSHYTSMQVGKWYPHYIQECYPGDEFHVPTRFVSRCSSAFLRPVMDNLFMDEFYFFVPSRLVFDKFGQIFGENDVSEWARKTTVVAPTVPPNAYEPDSDTGLSPGSVWDLIFGVTPSPATPSQADIDNLLKRCTGINILPARAYALIWNEWLRNENVDPPVFINKGNFSMQELPNTSSWSANNYTGQLAPAEKIRDYFTSALIAPQKGDPINIGTAVLPGGTVFPVLPGQDNSSLLSSSDIMHWYTSGVRSAGYYSIYDVVAPSFEANGISVQPASGVASPPTVAVPANLNAYNKNDLPLNSVNVNELRLAIQTQRMLERDARSGSRFTEYIQAAFGIKNPDARLQRPEFIYGHRTPLQIQQVAQTSKSDSGSYLGDVAAMSWSNGSSFWKKSLTEHGYIIGVSAIRYKHKYQQGIEKFHFRSARLDYYDPLFQSIGEQPILKRELYNTADTAVSDSVFGYQEAWADLRYRQSRVSGQMRSGVENSQDIYHFADFYDSAPVLSGDFMHETGSFVDRTIAVSSSQLDPFVIQWYFDQVAIRELPAYSVPSLMDHH